MTSLPTATELADRVWTYRLRTDAFSQLRAGVPVERLRPESLADREADAAFAREVLRDLGRLDDAAMSEDDRLTAGFLRFLMDSWAAAPQHHWHGFSVAPYSSFFLSYALQHVFGGFVFASPADGDRYVSLVGDYRDFVTELGTKLDGQVERGIRIPRPALSGVRESLTRNRAAAAGLLAVDPTRLSVLAREGSVLRETVERLVQQEVLPAYDAVLARLDDDYERTAPAEVGQWVQPGGEDFYRFAVRQHTSSDWTPEQIHEVGLDQVQQLTDEMAKARADMGFAGTEQEFHAQLAADPSLYASSPEEVEALYLRHMAALEPHLPTLFSQLPEAPYGVKRLSPQMEAGMTFGYYQVPTPSDPVGYYCYNGSALDQRSLLTAAALILHELAPGHHFHLAAQAENTALHPIRRNSMDLGAFNEGWAEYAAGLGWEVGLYDAPLDRYGRLVHERFTAQRLVVDTGLNLFGWSLEEARAYAKANTTDSDVQVATETIRYATDLPGQALAYRLGFLEITRMRAEVERVQGTAFDVRAFHEHVLGGGALPFPVLDAHLQRWTGS